MMNCMWFRGRCLNQEFQQGSWFNYEGNTIHTLPVKITKGGERERDITHQVHKDLSQLPGCSLLAESDV